MGTLNGTSFNDINFNGIFDVGDIPLPNVTVFLDTNGNGLPDSLEAVTITDINGFYSFPNRITGNYLVEQVVPPGFIRTTPATSVTLTGSVTDTVSFNIANVPQTLATGNITGRKFIDLNNNGSFEAGTDQPQSGVTLFLDGNNNGQLDTGELQTQTDSDGVKGLYLFGNLPTGTYTVQEIVPTGFTRITPVQPVNVLAFNTTTFDIANIQQTPTTGNISGTKFNDLNANGILDIGEPGIAGIAIYLDLNNNSTLDTNEPGTLTDTRGFYQFNNLQPNTYQPNTYIVREVQQPGFISTLVPNPVTIVPGLNVENINFGNGIPGILEFSNPIFSVNEDGTTNMDVMVTRTGGSVGAVDVTVLPSNGTANAGTDYNPTPITVSFINGDNTPKPIRIPIIKDSRVEPDETINLALVNPTNGAVLGVQSTATLIINRSDTGVPLNLGTVGDLRTVANNPLVLESGLNFSTNALGIVSVEQGGSGNFIDPLTNPGQLATAITYDQGQSIIINVADGFDQKFSFRYGSPFADHQVTIYEGVNGTGNVLASVQLPRTPDSNLTPGAYILENNPSSTLFFEGIAKSVILGSQPNKLLINNITFG
ncbi:SdrD B-like domain-containing protein [Planktothrix pseudagardhii]|uniref:Colossin-A n=1 Tax=Planktothrix pseudagardhii TaxID=132604 RepID=A0A9W4CQY5_9CYAN|nr:SdrD B-like domain-containing protein [Planktothrix pseudagardhii]CAD5978870.1 Colossin-A [Planktothrix pseudagardhii]